MKTTNKYPRIVINETKFKQNIRRAIEICKESNIEVLAVTKGFVGNRRMAEIYSECGIKMFGDSRIENFKVYSDIPGHKQLLRLPQLEEIPELLTYCDSSLNGDLKMIKAISDYVVSHNLKPHKIVLMIDLGDRREGVLPEDVDFTVQEILKLKGVELFGLGCNFGCYGARIPSVEAMNLFIQIKNEIEAKYHITISHISGGNSLSLHMVWEKTMPKEVNVLRMGFSMIFGTEDKYRLTIEGMHRDAFRCEAEVVEVDYKSSLPIGPAGIDAFGKEPVFVDEGDIKRLILAIGKLDTSFDDMYPYDSDLKVLGGSSDLMILNATKSKNNYQIGDIITFALDWGSLLYLFNSRFVDKVFEI